ncbi:prefoldin subunit [Trichosporon asahii var. asahii CBS 8904]|uniref:Prefoldin subunit 3 n=1 Tax=Trichosporon asahii var. asahii (strain CBS 8904) TaxID=1220162 RepID=K1V600_TRIAC|nr:prefoldin subunit [Trichosporon asahii var. asahii CBS 8904]
MATTKSPSPQMELNPRGIPKAPFVLTFQANVEDYVGTNSVEPIIKTFQETSAKYRYMELNLQQRRKALLAKIPDIEQTLSVVKFLQARREPKPAASDEKDETGSMNSDDIDALLDGDDEEAEEGAEQKPLKTLFELNDTLFAEATVQETGEVGLWLGANTMLLYPLAEAAELLEEKLSSAKKSLKEAVEDLEWIREQVTVMEVNFARVHNWDVKRRREQKKHESVMGHKDEDEDK